MVDINMLEGGLLMPSVSETGQLVSFNALAPLDIKTLKVAITPTQSGTGDPSPTNIRPISGWTGATIRVKGKNFLNANTFAGGGQTCFEKVGDNNYTFTKRGTGNSQRFTNRATVSLPAGVYSFSFKTSLHFTSTVSARFYINGAYESNAHTCYYRNDGYYYFRNLSLPTGVTGMQVYFANNSTGVGESATVSDFLLERSDVVTEYEPFATNKYDISWSDSAGTVYGGELDVLTGKLTAYPYYASYAGETINGEWISDRDVYAEGITPTIGAQVAVISGTGTENTLTATEMQTLIGQNNIWADCGDITLKTSPVFGKIKIRLMEEGISILNSSPLLRSASSPAPDTEEDTKTVKEPIEDIVKEPVDEKDTVKELPEDENEPEPEDEEVTEDDNERTDI